MKALKIKYLKGAITVFALCLIGTASAATNGNGDEKEEKVETKKVVLAPQWFEYTGPGASDPDYNPHNPNFYTAVDPSDEPSCEGAEQVCGIKATPDPGSDPNNPLPSLSDLQSLASAINSMTPVDDQLTFRDE